MGLFVFLPSKVTVWFRAPSLEEPDNELQREFGAHSPQIWPGIKKEVGERGKPASHCGWSRTILLHDLPIFQLAIDTIIMVIESYKALLFYFYLPGRNLTAAHVSLHGHENCLLFPPVGFVCLKDVPWMAWYTLLTLLSGCWMRPCFGFWLLIFV